jgi:hypothetical protein
VKTYLCRSCNGSITVGHPGSLFRRQARAILRQAYSLLERVFRRRNLLARVRTAQEERYYLEPFRYRTLPRKCPRCGFRGQGDLPWWRPGFEYGG